MRNLLSFVAVAALGMVGCNHSPEGGSPGTAATFTINAPTVTTTIKQDNKQSVSLTLSRSSGFKQNVRLEASAPAKIKAELSKTTIAAGDDGKVELTIAPAKDAPLGDQDITVTGTPEGGQPTSVKVRINVEKNP